jgi:hypothetical protein
MGGHYTRATDVATKRVWTDSPAKFPDFWTGCSRTDGLARLSAVVSSAVRQSDFVWWVWLVLAAGALVVCSICGIVASFSGDEDHGFIMYLFGVVAFVAGLIGFGWLQ